MSVIRSQLVDEAINKAYALTVFLNDFHEQFEFRKQTIFDYESLTKDEKLEAIRSINEDYDYDKILYNDGTKRICENCQLECLATSFCELCIRNYLKANFSNWTSGNNDIDDLIQKCQIETFIPNKIIEWIPYNNLQNINYLTKGRCSEIYTAEWIGGGYEKWDSKEQQLERFGIENVILKTLKNVESANRSWFDEAKSHLTISNKWSNLAKSFGLTQDPLNKDYMLVMAEMHIDLRKYLKQDHNQLTWKKRIRISFDIINALIKIHSENAIHRDLHSGNILYLQYNDNWYISDLGFCGPADKPLKSIYGNLPYIAPEVISGKEYTFASDIYSIAMLMWEISSGQPPFANFNYSDYDLAMNIINGMRPKIIPGTPLEYKRLMQQCWDADPLNRPDIVTVYNIICEIRSYYQNENDEQTDNINHLQTNSSSSSINSLVKNFSKVHIFEGLPEPRNATEEEQEAYHSKLYDFEIPESIEDIISNDQTEQNDFTMINDKNNEEKNKSKRIYPENFDDKKEDLSNKSKKIKLENDEEIHAQYTYNKVGFQHVHSTSDDEDDEIYNNPNLHPEDQNEFEIPEDF